MAFSASSIPKFPSCSVPNFMSPSLHDAAKRFRQVVAAASSSAKCALEEPNSQDGKVGSNSKGSTKLTVGSPVIFIEAPKAIKTANSMPCLRINTGLVKPGDVGRIVSRKPKDVWAVRLNIGTYLIDGKYFKALELEE